MVEIKNSLENDIFTIFVIGEVDASSSIHLDESISEATSKHKKIIVNCEQLEYISSAGLGVFMSYIDVFKWYDLLISILVLYFKCSDPLI